MSCSCKNRQQDMEIARDTIAKLRELFITRMTVDSPHHDRRRRDYNQAIFCFDDYNPDGIAEMCSMDEVLACFDDAVRDYRDTFCDHRTSDCAKRWKA